MIRLDLEGNKRKSRGFVKQNAWLLSPQEKGRQEMDPLCKRKNRSVAKKNDDMHNKSNW